MISFRLWTKIKPNYQSSALLIGFCFALLASKAQNVSIQLGYGIPFQAEHLASEPDGGLIFSNQHKIYRLNSKLDTLHVQSLKTKGELSSISANQKLRTLLFYQDQLVIIVIDNTLSQQGDPADLLEIGIPACSLIEGSVNNSIWLFDNQSQELVRISSELLEEFRSQNMIALHGNTLQPSAMRDINGELVLADPVEGVFWFDRFGALADTFPIPHVKRIHPLSREVLLETDTELIVLSRQMGPVYSLQLPVENIVNISISGSNGFILTKDMLYPFRLGEHKK